VGESEDEKSSTHGRRALLSQKFREDSVLINDADIAGMLGMSRSWVRKQRFNRRHGLPHALTVDPVMIGSAPRYRRAEVIRWVASLESEVSGSGVTARLSMPGSSHTIEGEG
jgi:predicted DNA-binding transcriptional regulator AlpA